MAKYQKQSSGAEKEPRAKETSQGGADADSEESCRCKEVAKKTPGELLRLMIGDLAFWKKGKEPK